ncbi:condensation protein [Streptomyces sp. NPDC056061]|uniref:phthiocerol/phthiodiolone dimycocerosyl transferase family protein n=1 Tax=Streptomyces sp. NPDC056061 TaxID=3345700 RepID=UPI0035E0AD43
MERLLAPHEAAIAAAGVRVVLYSEVEGELDEAVLAQALIRLRACYPLTAGRITAPEGEEGPLIRVDDAAAGPVISHGVDFDEEINTPLAWDRGPLLRLAVMREPGRTRVVLTLPRAFVDGMSYLAVHERLWSLYTALATDRPAPAVPVQPVLGPALDDLLAARFAPQQLLDFVADRERLDVSAPPALLPALASRDGGPGPDLRFGITGLEAGTDQRKQLARRAEEASLTLNSLVSGILLTGLRALFPAQDGPVQMLCTTAVDMRRRLSPPLPADVLQSAATTTSIRIPVTDQARPAEVGQKLAAQLRADLRSGAAAMELAAFPYMIDQHPPSLVITNVGTIPEPELPDGLRITNVRLAPLGHVPMIFAVVSQYQGRLAVDLAHSRAWHTDTQINELGGQVSAIVNRLTT